MLTLSITTLLAALSQARAEAAYGSPEERQFDFWIGEWDVNNRSLTANAGWTDAGRSRARIRPIVGGKAILEEWDGRSGSRKNTFGISVRYYDPGLDRWVIALNWPSASNASFSRMEGSFRHGRAEFFPPAAAATPAPRATRFTFSDALPDTCRWDMADPVANGGWRTTWIMEFSRAKSKAATVADGEPIRLPAERPVCAASNARQFDPLVGEWAGQGWRATAGGKEEVDALFRASSTNRGCATLCFLDVSTDAGATSSSFEAWAWYGQQQKWVARTIDDRTPGFEVMVGEFADGDGTFVRTDRQGQRLTNTRRVHYHDVDDLGFHCVHDVSNDGGQTWTTVLDITFERQ